MDAETKQNFKDLLNKRMSNINNKPKTQINDKEKSSNEVTHEMLKEENTMIIKQDSKKSKYL